MLFSKIQGSATTSSGSVSFNTPKFSMGYLRQLIFIPATSTNVWDLTIVDEYGFVVLPTEDIKTTAIEGTLCVHKVDLPLVGIYTITISNSTVDEKFTYEIMTQED
jgi:hypothetical protein